MNIESPQAASQFESQRSYSQEIFQSLKDQETPNKKLVIFPITIKDKDPRGSGIGLAYKFVSTKSGLFGWLSR